MNLMDRKTLDVICKELEKQDIVVDIRLEQLEELLSQFVGGDDDPIIGDEFIEYYDLRVSQFKEIGHWDDGDVAYIHLYNFDNFCILADDYGSLSEFYEEYVG